MKEGSDPGQLWQGGSLRGEGDKQGKGVAGDEKYGAKAMERRPVLPRLQHTIR